MEINVGTLYRLTKTIAHMCQNQSWWGGAGSVGSQSQHKKKLRSSPTLERDAASRSITLSTFLNSAEAPDQDNTLKMNYVSPQGSGWSSSVPP